MNFVVSFGIIVKRKLLQDQHPLSSKPLLFHRQKANPARNKLIIQDILGGLDGRQCGAWMKAVPEDRLCGAADRRVAGFTEILGIIRDVFPGEVLRGFLLDGSGPRTALGCGKQDGQNEGR